MDQIKIGKFIAEKRKKHNLTQVQLAEKLNITDRAVSKWENGQCAPELTVLAELADFFEVSIDTLVGHNLNADKEVVRKPLCIRILHPKRQSSKPMRNG